MLYPDAVTPTMLAFRMPFDCWAPLELEVSKRDPDGALVTATADRPDRDIYQLSASIALACSLVVTAVATFLRRRVARADPGQFDDSAAAALKSAGGIHRFARWGRQWIKRSTMAHLIVFLALIDQLPVLLYLWAFGATVAAIVILVVEPFVVRRVAVAPAGHAHGG